MKLLMEQRNARAAELKSKADIKNPRLDPQVFGELCNQEMYPNVHFPGGGRNSQLDHPEDDSFNERSGRCSATTMVRRSWGIGGTRGSSAGKRCYAEYETFNHRGDASRSPSLRSPSLSLANHKPLGQSNRPSSSMSSPSFRLNCSIRTPPKRASSQLSTYDLPIYKASVVQPWAGDVTTEVERAAWGVGSPHRVVQTTEENLFTFGSPTKHLCSNLMAPMRHLNTWQAPPPPRPEEAHVANLASRQLKYLNGSFEKNQIRVPGQIRDATSTFRFS